MSREYRRKRLKLPLRVRLQRIWRGALILVVVALVPCLLWFQTRNSPLHRFTGVAEGESETVGATSAARITVVEVVPGQAVAAGDVLVRLDPADRAVDMALHEARIANYTRGISRYEQDLERLMHTLTENERRYSEAVNKARIELESEKLSQARDEAELAGMKAEVERLQPLVTKRLVSEIELMSLRPKIEALEQVVGRYKPLLEALEQRLEQSQQQLKAAQEALAEQREKQQGARQAEAALQEADEAFRQAATSEPYVLRAARDGVVSRVQRYAGDVVAAGEPIVRLTPGGTQRITGYLAAHQAEMVREGDKLLVERIASKQCGILIAMVAGIEPEVMDMLDPFNPAPRFSVRGRRIRLQLEGEAELVPGESVVLRQQQAGLMDSIRALFRVDIPLK